MTAKKKKFLEAYEMAFGNISRACKAVNMSRQTFYQWKAADAKFAQALVDLEPQEIFVDFAENALVKKIQDGDTTAIIFALKTKGKKRGYVERQEHGIDLMNPIFNAIDLDVPENNGTGENSGA